MEMHILARHNTAYDSISIAFCLLNKHANHVCFFYDHLFYHDNRFVDRLVCFDSHSNDNNNLSYHRLYRLISSIPLTFCLASPSLDASRAFFPIHLPIEQAAISAPCVRAPHPRSAFSRPVGGDAASIAEQRNEPLPCRLSSCRWSRCIPRRRIREICHRGPLRSPDSRSVRISHRAREDDSPALGKISFL